MILEDNKSMFGYKIINDCRGNNINVAYTLFKNYFYLVIFNQVTTRSKFINNIYKIEDELTRLKRINLGLGGLRRMHTNGMLF